MKGKLVVQELQKRRYHRRQLKKTTRVLNYEFSGQTAFLQKKRSSFLLVTKQSLLVGQTNLESARKYLFRHLKSKARKRLVVYTFPVYPDVRKPQEIRMGKGKGQKFVDNVEKAGCGKVLFGYRGRANKLLKVFKSKLTRGVDVYKFKI